MIRERRGRAAAHVVVAPIDTAQPCNPRSISEISFDVHVCVDKNTEREMDPEPGELKTSSAGTNHHRLVRISSNHHRLIQVLKHPDSNVSRSGRWDEPLLTAASV